MVKNYHPRLSNRVEIAGALRHINDAINGCGFNFSEATQQGNSLAFAMSGESDHPMIILASFDFSYYHDLELAFYEVGYTTIGPEFTWWDHWTKDQIELSEQDFPDGFEFRFNVGTHTDHQYIVHAKSFSYHLGRYSYRI